jgi:hypothetical protein
MNTMARQISNREKLIDMAEEFGIAQKVAIDMLRCMSTSDVEGFCEAQQIDLECSCRRGARDTLIEMIEGGAVNLDRNAWGGGLFVALVNWHTNDEIEEFCDSEGYEI